MTLVALITWLITASAGLYLLAIWLIEYDHEFQSAAATRLPVPVISAHALLALAGLAVWAAYLITDVSRLAWVAAVILGVVATLGLSMAVRWFAVYRAHGGPSAAVPAPARAPEPSVPRAGASVAGPGVRRVGVWGAGAPGQGGPGEGAFGEGYRPESGGAETARVPVPPERHFPLPVVIAHGVFAATTIVLVLLTALNVFGG